LNIPQTQLLLRDLQEELSPAQITRQDGSKKSDKVIPVSDLQPEAASPSCCLMRRCWLLAGKVSPCISRCSVLRCNLQACEVCLLPSLKQSKALGRGGTGDRLQGWLQRAQRGVQGLRHESWEGGSSSPVVSLL